MKDIKKEMIEKSAEDFQNVHPRIYGRNTARTSKTKSR